MPLYWEHWCNVNPTLIRPEPSCIPFIMLHQRFKSLYLQKLQIIVAHIVLFVIFLFLKKCFCLLVAIAPLLCNANNYN